ncbi:YchJ family metal-binding protein [uncultured Sunxiuqinia sp.]|uniref:YchJ family protein n=1 Tax=uncultured Sunxiuqinia sp. TaxID=1573825 RepID=UPI002AA71313|nr:YchJ family metal-binding protein [uncultured Sunxiuqinia sp.]
MNRLCLCGSKKEISTCCEAILSGRRQAATALELMRSRYVAFTKANGAYLMGSHHSETRPVKERISIEKWARSVNWVSLTILSTEADEATDEAGKVEFRALYTENGNLEQIHENSLFKRENGKWVYHSGIHY